MNIFVYGHYRPETKLPFYIGIGKSVRLKYVERPHNKHHSNILNKLNRLGLRPIVKVIASGLSWDEAASIEKDLIKLYGRKDLGKGILVNLTDGGEGQFGIIPSEERRMKISKAHKGVPKLKLKGRKHSEEFKKRVSDSLKGRTFSEERCKNISLGRKGKGLGKRNPTVGIKISLKKKGVKFSNEHRAKLSTSRKRFLESQNAIKVG